MRRRNIRRRSRKFSFFRFPLLFIALLLIGGFVFFTQRDSSTGNTLAAQSNVVEVYTAGTDSAQMQLLINDNVVATYNNVGGNFSARNFVKYTYTHSQPVSAGQVKVSFTNDNGASRNLYVDRIVVGGVTYQSEAATTYSTGAYTNNKCQSGGGYFKTEKLSCKGYFRYEGQGSSDSSNTGTTVIDIYTAVNGYPTMTLMINNQTVATWTNVKGNYSTRNFTKYSYTAKQAVDISQIKVSFVNDSLLNNLYIDKIVVNGTTYQSEAPNTFSTGAYANGACQGKGGYFKKEKLSCNGYFRYGDATTSTPAPSPTPVSTETATPTPITAASPTSTPVPPPSSTDNDGDTAGGRGPQTNPDIPAGAVYINPGQSIQAAVDANPNGATFVLRSGMHRLTSRLNPKTGNVFIGEYGAIVSGARLLTNFTQEGNLWVANVSGFGLKIDTRYPNGKDALGLTICETAYPRCHAQHDLFINSAPLRHVASKGEVSGGEFFLDYNAGKVYFADSPNGKTVELSATDQFVSSSVADLTFSNLIIEKFASPGQIGALQGPGNGWKVDNNTLRYNHGLGIKWNKGWQITDNLINMNGHMGGGGAGDNQPYLVGGGGSSDNVLLQNNEFGSNNFSGWKMNWEAGAFKVARATGVTIRNNYVHDNQGPGIWIDIDNVDILIEGNQVKNNARAGIKYEISYDGIIRNNTVRFNGSVVNEGLLGAQIEIHSSSNVEVYGNTAEIEANYGDGIVVFHKARGNYGSGGNYIHDNTIYFNGVDVSRADTGHTGAEIRADSATFLTTQKNRFDRNTYIVPNTSLAYFRWSSGTTNMTWTQFRAAGNEPSGTIRQK